VTFPCALEAPATIWPMDREIARLEFEGNLRTLAEEPGKACGGSTTGLAAKLVE